MATRPESGWIPAPTVPSALIPVFFLLGHLDWAVWLYTPLTPASSLSFEVALQNSENTPPLDIGPYLEI